MKINDKPLTRTPPSARFDSAEFFLPWAPSTNRVWRSTATSGRAKVYRDEKYDAFLNKVRALAYDGLIPGIARKKFYRVRIECYPPNARRFDLDNRMKATLDALTLVGFWEDDSQVIELTAIKKRQEKNGRLRVCVEATDDFEGITKPAST